VLWGELRPGDPPIEEPARPDHARPPERGAAQRDAAPVDEVTRVVLDEKEREDAVLIHSFEKVDTADEHQGGARDLDGSDELADHAEALEEVKLGKVVRCADPVHAVLRADPSLSADIPDVATIEPGERGIPYDEWDEARRAYRPGFCTVYPTPFARADPAWAREALARSRPLVRRLVRELSARRSRLAPQRAQRDGEAIDLDAFVRHLAAANAFEAGAPRLYVRRARAHRDLATTLLLDLSLSSDAWVDDRRVLDVTRESALVLGEVAEALGDPLEILGFASHTRNRCRVFEIRPAGTPWATGRARLGALVPQGYTRIGPALRHAAQALARRPAKDRLLLLLTDGKPTDYDRYEGRHGIADVRQAVREADRLGVRVHALAIDRAARDDLPAMVGPGRFHALRDAADLPRALVSVYAAFAR
jgi:nitric oxide reductase NorD protein